MPDAPRRDEMTVTVDRLVVHLTGYRRLPSARSGIETVELDMAVENPPGSPGSTRRLPQMELRDAAGSAYDVIQDDSLAVAVKPTEQAAGHPRFEVPADSTGLSVVIAPGTEGEAVVPLAPPAAPPHSG